MVSLRLIGFLALLAAMPAAGCAQPPAEQTAASPLMDAANMTRAQIDQNLTERAMRSCIELGRAGDTPAELADNCGCFVAQEMKSIGPAELVLENRTGC